jgi:hypothetical protein
MALGIVLPTGRTIQYADEKAALFFVTDVSAVGGRSYDSWVVSAQNDRSRITDGDLTAINTSMRARSPRSNWSAFIQAIRHPWLDALDMDWDLVSMSPDRWDSRGVHQAIHEAITAVNGPHRRAAATTKLLHIKRPALIPVCDSYVAASMGMQAWGPDTTTDLIVAIRALGRTNLPVLKEIRARLKSIGIDRTYARILDVLLWFSAPSSAPGAYGLFEDWLVNWHGGRLFF